MLFPSRDHANGLPLAPDSSPIGLRSSGALSERGALPPATGTTYRCEFFAPPARFTQKLELPAQVSEAQSALFALRRLLAQLEGFLAARQAGVRGFRVLLMHPDCAPTGESSVHSDFAVLPVWPGFRE